MRRLAVVPATLALVLLPGTPAWAHNELTGSDPAEGAVLTGAPQSVTLRFLGSLNPDFTTIVVSGPARQRVPAGEPVVDGASATVTLQGAMGNGGYTVAYRTVSTDGHVVQGSYGFSVADPSAPAPERSSGTPVLLLLGIGVVLVGAIVCLVRWRRIRSRRTSGNFSPSDPD